MTTTQSRDAGRWDRPASRVPPAEAALGPPPLTPRLLGRDGVDHRVPLLPLRRLLALARRGFDQARLDAELAQAEPIIGLEVDLGAGEQRVIVPARVLEQIAGELLLQRALVTLQALVILDRQPDRVLVRHVRPGHGCGSVGIHLLGELARQLHRLDLRGERPAEGPLDQVLDALLQVSQDADAGLLRGSVKMGVNRVRESDPLCAR